MIVILNLVTVIPAYDELIIGTILGGCFLRTVPVYRMFSLHYALAIVVLACILVHLILIHRSQPGAVSSASDNHVALADVVLKNFILIPKLRNRLAASSACAHSSRLLTFLMLRLRLQQAQHQALTSKCSSI